MTSRLRLSATLLGIWVAAAAATTVPAPLAPAAYVAALAQFDQALQDLRTPADAARLDRALPPEWLVASAPGSSPIAVRLGWYHRNLAFTAALAPVPVNAPVIAATRALLAQHLALLRREALAPPPPPGQALRARASLHQVLSRPAYRFVAPPSLWDQLVARGQLALLRAAAWLLQRLALDRSTGTLLLDLLLLLACAGAAWLLLHLATHRSTARPLRLAAASAALPNWRLLRASAQSAERRGDWTAALRHTYAAAVALLDARSVWRADHARTPREYLALLAPPLAPPLAPNLAAPWRELVAQLESVAYAGATANAAANATANAIFAALEAASLHSEP